MLQQAHFLINPAAYGLDGLDTGLRYDSNGNLICINNGYPFVPTNPDGTAGAPHCFTTNDNSNTPVLATIDKTKTKNDLIAVENKSPLDHANYLGHDSYVVKPLTGNEPISPYSEEISRYSLQRNAELNRFLIGSNIGWGLHANESIPVYTVDSSNPYQEYATFTSNDNRVKAFSRLSEVALGKIPLPTWWADSWSGDKPLAIYDVATGIWRSYFHAVPTDGTNRTFNVSAAGYYYAEPNFGGVGENYWLSLIQGSSSVVGLSNELTQISVDDIRSGSIEHMVSMTWHDYLNTTSFPAKQVSDGRDTYAFAPRPGQMFTLPKDLDIDAYAKKERLDPVNVMIMKAIQKYGGIITDRNAFTSSFNFEHPAGVGPYARNGKNIWMEDPTLSEIIKTYRNDHFPIEKLQWIDIHYAGQPNAKTQADLTPAASAPIGARETQQYATVDAIYQDERAFMRPSDYVAIGDADDVFINQARNVPDGTSDLYNTTVVGNEFTPTATWYQYPRDLRAAIPVEGFTGQLVKYWNNPAWNISTRLSSSDSIETRNQGTVAKWTVNVVAKDQPLARTDTFQVAPGKTISVDVFANDSSAYGKADGPTAFKSLKLINSKGQAVDAINTKRGYAKVNGNKIDFTALNDANGQIIFTYQGTTADGRKSTGAIEIRMLGKVRAYTAADVAEISDPIPTQATSFTPVGKDQSVMVGTSVTAKNSISNAADMPAGTTFTYKTAVNTSTAGVKDVIVVVKYPDGSSEEVKVKVTVRATPITDKNNPVYSTGSGTPGTNATIAAPKNSDGSALPTGTTFKTDNTAFKASSNGALTVAVPANAKDGDVLSSKVTVTYSDGTTDVVTVKLTVSDKVAPVISTIANQTVATGQALTNIAVKTNDPYATVGVTGLPAGVTYNASTGVISGTPYVPGTYTATVKATDRSGNVSTKTFTISVKVVPVNQQNDPSYKSVSVAPGATASLAAPLNSNGSALPAGTTFKVDNSAFRVASNGALSVTAPANAKNGAVLSTNVTVTYRDGTTDVVPVKVSIVDKTAPVISGVSNQTLVIGKALPNQTVKTNDRYATVTVTGLPAGVTYNASTGVISGTPSKVGNYTMTVKATDLSGNVATQTFTVTVKALPMADSITPVYANGIGAPAVTTKIAAPTKQNGAALPAGTTFASSNPAFVLDAKGAISVAVPANAKDGAVLASNITVKYPDGTSDVVPVKVTVSDKVAPVVTNIANQTVNAGAKLSDIAVKTNDSAATITVTGLPSGVSFNAKTGVISGTPMAPGNYPVTVTATDPSGNKTVKTFTLTVRPVPDAQKYTPAYKNGAGVPGATVKVAAPLNSNGSALPAGTTFKSDNNAVKVDAKTGAVTVAIPANAKNGDVYSAKITVTYPDGTSDVVPVSVTAGDKTAPVIAAMGNQNILIGDTVTDVAVQTNDAYAQVTVSGLPAGVTYRATPGAATGGATTYTAGVISGAPTKAGTSTVTVKATDRSGNVSTKTFTIKVNAVPMTDTNTPSYINGFGVPGVALKIVPPTNVDGSSMPEGTTFTSDNPAFVLDEDGSMTVEVPVGAKDGDVLTGNITVTYADGTTEVIPVSVTVSDTVAPLVADIAEQSAVQGQEIEPLAIKTDDLGAKVTVSGLPEGLTYNAETGLITGTPASNGNYTVSVLATDPSGNSSTRTFNVVVSESAAPAPEVTEPAPSDPAEPAPADPTQPAEPAPSDSAPSDPAQSEPSEEAVEPAQPETADPTEVAQPVAPAPSEQPAEAAPAETEAPAAEPSDDTAPVAEQPAEQNSAAEAVVSAPTSDPTNVPGVFSVGAQQSTVQTVDSAAETTDQAPADKAQAPVAGQTDSAVTFGSGSASQGGYGPTGQGSYANQGYTDSNGTYYQSGGEESFLANTGANVVGWGLAGISAMAGGVVVLGARRRKEAK